MGHRLPDDKTPDPADTPPPFVLVIFTAIITCPDPHCSAIPALKLPLNMYLPAASPGAAWYRGWTSDWYALYDPNYPPYEQSFLWLTTADENPNNRLFEKFSDIWNPWATILPNHLTSCLGWNCGHSGNAVIFHDFAATQAAQLLGIPPSPTRFWEPFIAGDGSPVYRFADRTLGINILQKTEL